MDTRSILIVDDNPKLRRTLSGILRAKGYVPTITATGKAALDKIEEEKPVVALIDLKLEDMSGLEVMRKIKERSVGTECIVLTGYATQASAIEAVNVGAYSYVQKPYDVEQLLVTIRRAIEKRNAEEALRKSNKSLAEAQKIAHLGNWDWDIVANEVSHSDEIYRIWGVNPENCKTFEDFAELSHPDDAERNVRAVENALRGKKPYDIEYRIVRPDGTVRWIHARGEVLFNETREPVRMMGITQDITDRKQAEEMLRESERRLARVETLRQTLVTLSHHINNAMAAIAGNAELCDLGGVSADKLVKVCLSQTQRISAVLKALGKMVKEMDIRTTDYAGVEDAMFDIEGELRRTLEET